MSSQSELEQYLETQYILYYTNGTSDISDAEFNSLKSQLPKDSKFHNKVGMPSVSNKIAITHLLTR